MDRGREASRSQKYPLVAESRISSAYSARLAARAETQQRHCDSRIALMDRLDMSNYMFPGRCWRWGLKMYSGNVGLPIGIGWQGDLQAGLAIYRWYRYHETRAAIVLLSAVIYRAICRRLRHTHIAFFIPLWLLSIVPIIRNCNARGVALRMLFYIILE